MTQKNSEFTKHKIIINYSIMYHIVLLCVVHYAIIVVVIRDGIFISRNVKKIGFKK